MFSNLTYSYPFVFLTKIFGIASKAIFTAKKVNLVSTGINIAPSPDTTGRMIAPAASRALAPPLPDLALAFRLAAKVSIVVLLPVLITVMLPNLFPRQVDNNKRGKIKNKPYLSIWISSS